MKKVQTASLQFLLLTVMNLFHLLSANINVKITILFAIFHQFRLILKKKMEVRLFFQAKFMKEI